MFRRIILSEIDRELRGGGSLMRNTVSLPRLGHATFREQGVGAPVLLIHGVGLQSAAWGPQLEALGTFYRVIAVDMPGHGGSSPLPQGSQLPDFVAWCHDFVKALDIGPVSVAGHSMGALIAGGFAVEHPGLTARVALINGVFRRSAAARSAVIERASAIKAGEIDMETPLRRWFGAGSQESAVRRQVADLLRAVDPAGYATAYDAFARGDATYAERYSEITCPFLALTGDDDPNSTAEMSHAMVARSPSGKSVVIAGERHMVNLTAPESVNDHLSAWLRVPSDLEVLQ